MDAVVVSPSEHCPSSSSSLTLLSSTIAFFPNVVPLLTLSTAIWIACFAHGLGPWERTPTTADFD